VVSNKKKILRDSFGPDRRSQTSPMNRDLRETSNSGELQGASRSKATNSVAPLVKGEKKLRTKESAHKRPSPLV
jgi:hypothetical protein